MFKNLLISLIFFLYSVISFSEVPHSYVTENPKKEVQKVETFKQRDKAELNLSVTKIKTKKIYAKKNRDTLNLEVFLKDLTGEKFIITENSPLNMRRNRRTLKSNNSINLLETRVVDNKLNIIEKDIHSENPIFINSFDKNNSLNNIYEIMPLSAGTVVGHINHGTAYMDLEITDKYDSGIIYRVGGSRTTPVYGTDSGKGIKVLNYTKFNNGYPVIPYRGGSNELKPGIMFAGLGYEECNGIRIYETRKTSGSGSYYVSGYPYTLSSANNYRPGRAKTDELDVEFVTTYHKDEFGIRIHKYPKKDFIVTIYVYGVNNPNGGENYYTTDFTSIFNFKYIPDTLKGSSTLTFKEYYSVNEFVQFTANPTIQNAQPLALDNSVKDVTLETTGKGLVTMQQGDKLTVDGHEVVIGAGGNIGPQKLTIGNVKYTYEVKNGKFRIALNEWGVLEPNRTIPIKIVRNENGSDKSLAEHNLTIKAPRKVAGTVNLKLNQDYNIRSFINFNGINLNAPGQASLEQPIAPGVSLTSVSGQGIPFMKEGDILQINDGLTRAVKSFTVGANGNLGKQKVRLNNGDVTIYVESGKLRIGVDNWLVNKEIESQLRVLRGTNEIASHSFGIKAPEAPFNIKKNGLLDFGNVTSGTKRTAETDIVLEMLKDITDIEFSLKDSQPVMENLTTGNRLVTDKLEYLVTKQGNREYKIKLKGKLTIPEATKSGSYTGNTVLELKIK